jgi:hypothetical protein
MESSLQLVEYSIACSTHTVHTCYTVSILIPSPRRTRQIEFTGQKKLDNVNERTLCCIQACITHHTSVMHQHDCAAAPTQPGMPQQQQLVVSLSSAWSACRLLPPVSCFRHAPTQTYRSPLAPRCTACNGKSSPLALLLLSTYCHSASAAAACCATSGSLWLRRRRSTWRHTGSSPGACRQWQQNKGRVCMALSLTQVE